MQLRRRDVLEGAIAILDEYGLGDLTMRRLATSLGVQPGALYWHFPNKQALLAAITDEILAPAARPPDAGAAWDARIRTCGTRIRDALLSHRDGAEVATASYAARLASDAPRTALADACEAAGLPAPEAAMAAASLFSYVLGQTMDEQSRMQMDSHGALTDDASPLFESPTPTDVFEYGMGLFIEGVRARLAERSARLR